jgi:hypothetical protein
VLRKGAAIFIDTFYKTTGKVRIIIPGKDTVTVKKDDIREKVRVNAAG